MSYTVKALIKTIQAKPGMYLGQYSITRLKLFVDGYSFAREEAGEQFDADKLLSGFYEEVRARYSITVSQSWDAILWFVTGNEAKALDLFWELWDEYISMRAVNRED